MKLQKKQLDYWLILGCVYCVYIVMQNLFEMKTLGTSTLAIMGGGTIISWIPFVIMDVTSEVWGEKRSVSLFTIAGLLNISTVLLAQLVIHLPGVYPDQNAAFTQIFSNGPRTVISSFIAFYLGNLVNVKIMVRMRKNSRNKESKFLFFVRAVVSTIFGQILDNLTFAILAFAPIGLSVFEMAWKDILSTSLIGTCFETGIEACFVPLVTIPLANHIRKKVKSCEC